MILSELKQEGPGTGSPVWGFTTVLERIGCLGLVCWGWGLRAAEGPARSRREGLP